MRWDIFCRVVDNFGDIGVCWRLAADLAARGDAVRLWVDDASALAWMAPQGAPNVRVHGWPRDDDESNAPADAVIEAFGCQLPAGFMHRMAAQAAAPAWINLEYLSAEDYVERNHRLRSPQLVGAACGLEKWFYYPGFTAGSGGLIREPDLMARLQAFDAAAWRRTQGVEARPGERCVSLFCYANPALPALLDALARERTLLLVTAGIATEQVAALLGAARSHGALRVQYLPVLSQRDYDHLLWACDLNLVRGEDSFVRAQWAGKPFLWQAYPQHDGVHASKLAAFNDRFLAAAAPGLAAALRATSARWNGLAAVGEGGVPSAPFELPPLPAWQAHCAAWRGRLLALPDLASGLRAFVSEAR